MDNNTWLLVILIAQWSMIIITEIMLKRLEKKVG